ncbi:MAG: RNA polymerase sigma factor [Oscillospiraceae bacterium]|nr:RNA polymerase sigma factor [Oscillospiraceae bacterium]
MTEKELILASQKGSQVAYEELIHLHQKIVYYLVFFLCGNEETADEITRGVFVTAWNQISYLERMNRSFAALLCSLASRDCESFVKHKKRRVSGAIRMGDDRAVSPEITIFLEKLSSVPFHKRRILLLVDMCGLSIVEASEILSSTVEEVTAELEAARNSCDVSFGVIMPKLPEPAKSFAHEVSGDIQRSSGKENKLGALPEYRPSRRFVFGRFTIIAACVALLLLAYSGGFLGHKAPVVTPPSGNGSQSSETDTQNNDSAPQSGGSETTPQATTNPGSDTSGSGDETTNPGGDAVIMPEDTAPSGDSTLIPGDNTAAGDTTTGDNAAGDTAADGGGEGSGDSSSTSYIPSGEKYSAVYLSGTSAATTLSQFCAGSFRASLPDGTVAIYYMIPNANIDTAISALESAGITYAVYDAGPSIDTGAGNALFILFD